jgi:hypothetical protein
VYIKSYECKLLGINCDSKVANDVLDDLNEYICVDLKINDEFRCESGSDFIDFKVTESKLCNYPIKTPLILEKIEKILNDDEIAMNDESLTSLLSLLKDEWLNKTKVFYKYTKTPSIQANVSIESVLTMLNLSENDELALRFWQAGLSDECKTQIKMTL